MAQSELEERKLYYDSVYNEAVVKKDQRLMAEAFYLYGKYNQDKGNYQEAASFFHKALKILDKYPLTEKTAKVLTFLSWNATLAGDGDLVLSYAYQIERIYNLLGKKNGRKAALNILTTAMDINLTPSDTSDRLYLEALHSKVNKGIKSKSDLARYYFRKERFLEAYELYNDLAREQELKWKTKENTSIELVSYQISMAVCLIRLSRLDEAEYLLSKSDSLIQNYFPTDFPRRKYFLKTLTDLYHRKGNWKQAYFTAIRHADLERQQFLENANGAVTELNIAYETEKKEQILLLQQQEINNRNKLLYFLSIIFLILAISGIIFYRLYRKNTKLTMRNFYLFKEQNHRVKNNMQQIINLLNLQGRRLEDSEAKKVIEESKLRISSMSILQKQLYEDKEDADILAPQYIQDIIDSVLSSYGFQNLKKKIDIQVFRITPDDATALGLMITELLTNSCKYAFPVALDPELLLTIESKENKEFKLKYFDNGPGIAWERIDNRSFGMTLIDLEAKYFNAEYSFANKDGLKFKLQGSLKKRIV